MFEITRLTVEHLAAGCVTDCSTPRIGFSLSSDRRGAQLADAELTVGDWSAHVTSGQSAAYVGPALLPFTTYSVRLNATDDAGETATATTTFETGRMETPWKGRWISDPSYHFTEAKVSPVPMVFRKEITTNKPIARARLYATAMGIYEAELNGQKLGEQYFAPGFTSYKSYLQYQTYDVTTLLTGADTLIFTVAGGWAVGSFVFTRKNRVTADRQALLAELRIEYTDGTTETIGTDATWQVSESGPVRMADLYDGETYDATQEISDWHNAAPETLKVTPAITADYGAPVKAHEVRKPVAVMTAPDGETIYDFGQNLAGVVRIKFNGKAGQVVTVRHAEILNPDGSLNTTFLRTAKATATYTCRDGEQTYSPRFSYMGFRYAGVKGVDAKDLEIEAVALYSDVEHSGSFRCSDEMLNKLQSNITWGAKSNFVDIPTDCPQRDERMGWTGDIAVFSPTALYNFELSRFLEKWLRDVKAEQLRHPQHRACAGLRFPRHNARDGRGLVGRRLRAGAMGSIRGHGQPGRAAHDVPHHAEVRQGVLLLGRVRHRQAPLHLAHAVSAAFWRLGRPRCAEDESVAGPQQVHRHGVPVQHQRYTGENCTHPWQDRGRRQVQGAEP